MCIFTERGCKIVGIDGRKTNYLCPNGHLNSKRKDSFKNCKVVCKDCLIYNLKELFKKRNYELLENQYNGTKNKVKYKCPNGHYNYITPSDFKSGFGCPDCSKTKKITFNYIRLKFKELDYNLLTKEKDYSNSNSILTFICNKGHNTITNIQKIHSGRRCKECFQNKLLTIKYVKKQIELEDYILLSTNYIKSYKKLRIECPLGHQTQISWGKFKSGNRCRSCKNKGEQKCREIFEDYFGLEFPSCWPKWLNGLELDGYNDELKIAFEYNGQQHYEHIPFFHSGGIRTLKSQQSRDLLKLKLCKKNKIDLIVVPYTLSLKETKDLINKLGKKVNQ